jgi:integrase
MDYSTFLTLSYTGIRVGELVALQWKDIDFEKKCIRIIKTYYNPRNNTVHYILVTPKTTGSVRTIVVEDDVIEALKFHKKEQDKIKNRIGDSYTDNDFVFANTQKKSRLSHPN